MTLNLPIRFDRHAKRRMKWRRISEEEVYQALNNPDKMEESIRGRINVCEEPCGRDRRASII